MAHQVWHEHEVIAEHPDSHLFQVRENHLFVLDEWGRQVAHYLAGEWSAAGQGIACASLTDDPGCTVCHPELKNKA